MHGFGSGFADALAGAPAAGTAGGPLLLVPGTWIPDLVATELTRRARKLGCDVLWGSCSEAELALPYLPFVEAVGKHLDEQDPPALRTALADAL